MHFRLNFFLFTLTACLLAIGPACRLSLHALIVAFLSASALYWASLLIPRQIRSIVQLLLGELCILISLVDLATQITVSSAITPQILNNIILSSAQESYEFFLAFTGTNLLFDWRIDLLLLLVLIYPISFFPIFPLTPAISLSPLRKKVIPVVTAVCLICEVPSILNYLSLFIHKQDMNKLEGLIFQHYHEELPTPLHRLLFSYYSLRQASKALSATKDATLSARIDSCSYKSPHIIFVIGESYNKHHSTLYGYPLPTTPLQQMHKDKEELYVFEDVVTPWNITSNVFFDLFSLKSSKANTSTHNNPLFPILFRRAGYSVSFFFESICPKRTTQRLN